MTGVSAAIGRTLIAFSKSNNYPTRSVEHAFALMQMTWSGSVLLPGAILVGPQYYPMLAIMPEIWWGAIGFIIGVLRLVALIGNGHWRPSPELRLLGATWGVMFWIALAYCYYVAVSNGAMDFPMRRSLYVLTAFELYSCYRCGQDIEAARLKRKASASGLTESLGHG